MEPMLSAISSTIPGIPKGESWEARAEMDRLPDPGVPDGEEVALLSPGGRAMTRYFPEVLPAFRKLGPSRLVLDGGVVRMPRAISHAHSIGLVRGAAQTRDGRALAVRVLHAGDGHVDVDLAQRLERRLRHASPRG